MTFILKFHEVPDIMGTNLGVYIEFIRIILPVWITTTYL